MMVFFSSNNKAWLYTCAEKQTAMSHRRRMQRHLWNRRTVHLLCHFSCLFQILHFLCSIHRREWLLGIKCEPCWINWWDRTTVGYQRTTWLRRTGITLSAIIERSSLRDDSIDESSSTTDEWWETLVSQRVTRELFSCPDPFVTHTLCF